MAQRVDRAIGPEHLPQVRSPSEKVLEITDHLESKSGLDHHSPTKSASANESASASEPLQSTQHIASAASANRDAKQSDAQAKPAHLDQDRVDFLNTHSNVELQYLKSAEAINPDQTPTLFSNASSTQMGEGITDEVKFDVDGSRAPRLLLLTGPSDELVQRVAKAACPALQPAEDFLSKRFISEMTLDLSQEHTSSHESESVLADPLTVEPRSTLTAKHIKIERSIDDQEGQASSSTPLLPNLERSDLFESETNTDQRDRERAELFTFRKDAVLSDAASSSDATDEVTDELEFNVDPDKRADINPIQSIFFSFSSSVDEVAQRLNQVISPSQVLEGFVAQMTDAEHLQDQQPLDAPSSSLANVPQMGFRTILNASPIEFERSSSASFEQILTLPRSSDFNLQRSDFDNERYVVDQKDPKIADQSTLDEITAPIDKAYSIHAGEELAEEQNPTARIADEPMQSPESNLPPDPVSAARVGQSVDAIANTSFQMSRSQTAEPISSETHDLEASQEPTQLPSSRSSLTSDLPIGSRFNETHSIRQIEAESSIDPDHAQLNISQRPADDQRASPNIVDRSLSGSGGSQRQKVARSPETIGVVLENKASSAHQKNERSDALEQHASLATLQNALNSPSASGSVQAIDVANRVDEAINNPSSPLARSAPPEHLSIEAQDLKYQEMLKTTSHESGTDSVEPSDLKIDEPIEVEIPDSKARPLSSVSSYFPPTIAGRISALLNSCVYSSELKIQFGLLDADQDNKKIDSRETPLIRKFRLSGLETQKKNTSILTREFPRILSLLKKENLNEEKLGTWEEVNKEIRAGLSPSFQSLKPIFTETNYYLFTGLKLLPFAKKLLESQFQLDSSLTLEAQMRHTANQIDNSTTFQKFVANPYEFSTIQGRKFASKLNFFDAIPYNPPFSPGVMIYQSKKRPHELRSCIQLRHPVITIEDGPGKFIQIASEYQGFVESAAVKSQKICYCNHLSSGFDEQNRITAIKNFEAHNSNLFVISLPILSKVDDKSISNKETFCHYLQRLFSDPKLSDEKGFYFSKNMKSDASISSDQDDSSISNKNAEISVQREVRTEFIDDRAHVWIDFLSEFLIDENDIFFNRNGRTKQECSKEQKRIHENRVMYLTLLQSLVKRDVIVECQMDFSNNTCKDGIDRGAVHLFFDIYWAMLMNSQENDTEMKANLNALTFFPAFWAKKQAVLEDRLDIILAFARKIESLDGDDKKNLRNAWETSSLVQGAQFHFADGSEKLRGTAKYETGLNDKVLIEHLLDNKARIKNWEQLVGCDKDLFRSKGLPESVKFFGHNLVEVYHNNLDRAHTICEEDLKSNPIIDIFLQVFNPLRAAGGVLGECPGGQYSERLSRLAMLLTQAPAASACELARALTFHCCPGYTFGQSEKNKHLRRWNLDWLSPENRETIVFETTQPLCAKKESKTNAKLPNDVVINIRAEINTSDFFRSNHAPSFDFEYTIKY